MAKDGKKKTLTDAEITTDHPTNRRAVLGVMGAAGAAAALMPGAAQAQGTDSDNGSWTDRAGCGRGSGGFSTGITDADNGSLGTDAAGSGRGAPYC